MSNYLLVASRDSFSCNDVPYYYRLAQNLRSNGNAVTLFLVQNGVLPSRRSAASDALSALADSGVTVLADSFSLRERGIGTESLANGVTESQLDVVIDHLESGSKCLWH